MTIVYSCLCFVSISRGLMTKPVGFLRVPPLKFVEQIVWFFSFLISLLFGPFFSVYICVWFYLWQSNCNNGYFSRMSFVNFKVNIFLSYIILPIMFPNIHKSVLITKTKASILWYHLCYHIWNHIFYVSIFLCSLWIEWTSRNCLPSLIQEYLHAFLQATFFFFNSASAFLNFSSV